MGDPAKEDVAMGDPPKEDATMGDPPKEDATPDAWAMEDAEPGEPDGAPADDTEGDVSVLGERWKLVGGGVVGP